MKSCSHREVKQKENYYLTKNVKVLRENCRTTVHVWPPTREQMIHSESGLKEEAVMDQLYCKQHHRKQG